MKTSAILTAAVLGIALTGRAQALTNFVTGALLQEKWLNIPGGKLSNLTNSVRFRQPADQVSLVGQFEIPLDTGDDYGVRLSGYLRVPVSGDYTFFLSSDDEGALFLSTDDDPATKRLIAHQRTYSDYRAWRNAASPANVSEPIALLTGRWYYVEALVKEGARGHDHLGVTWRPPGAIPVANGTPPIPGAFLASYTRTNPTAGSVSAPASRFWITTAGAPGRSGTDDGSADQARFWSPSGLTVDSAGNVFVADTGNHTIRKITPEGLVSILAGFPGRGGSLDGTGTAARFNSPFGIAVDETGNVYVADTGNHCIRKVTLRGVVTTLAGRLGATGTADGSASAARFQDPKGIALDSAGNIYVADTGNHRIRKIAPGGAVTTLAGSSAGSEDGVGKAARFNQPWGIDVDQNGNLYVADFENHVIRQITPTLEVTTIAGLARDPGSADGAAPAAGFRNPSGVAVGPEGILYVADSANFTIREISPDGQVSTIGGVARQFGSADGVDVTARFDRAYDVALDAAGNLYVADSSNHLIRKGYPVAAAPAPVIVAPVITQQPQDVTVDRSATATFSVGVTGTPPLQYQWLFGEQALPGETNATLTLTNVQASQAGDYRVQVGNARRSDVFSQSARLTVIVPPPPVISQQPQSVTVFQGESAQFSVTASGPPPLAYGWFFNNTSLVGQTNATLSLANVTTGQAGEYFVIISNASGDLVTSASARLAVNLPLPPAIVPALEDSRVAWGESVSFTVTAAGTPPFQYEWLFNGATLPGQTNATLRLSNVTTNQAGVYAVVVRNRTGSQASSQARLTVELPPPPVIIQQPGDITVVRGDSVRFSVEAFGVPPLQYQWFFGSEPMTGETNTILALDNVTTNQTGVYRVTVVNPSAIEASSREAQLKVTLPMSPEITRQPTDSMVQAGATATFGVEATGSSPLRYQWFFGESNLAGETNATLKLLDVTTNQAGVYRVFVSNAYGSVSSANALLRVEDPQAGPANDLFVNRALLAGSALVVTNSNVNATKEPLEPNHAGQAGGRSLWWSWTAQRDGPVRLSTAGSALDTVLAVYTGTDLASLTPVASNDDDPSGGTCSLVSFPAQAGVSYQIAVDTFGGATGEVQLRLEAEVERPTLRLSLSGRNAVLSWPTNAVGFSLEFTERLAEPMWTQPPLSPVMNGQEYSVKIPLSNANRFHRLRGP